MRALLAVLGACLIAGAVRADSSSPLLAAYYDRQMAIVDGTVYAWQDTAPPKRLPMAGVQVGVGRDSHYVLTPARTLIGFRDDPMRTKTIMKGVTSFAAGESGIMAIREDGTLWHVMGFNGMRRLLDHNIVVDAAVGDSANYYITATGGLYVKGLAHRGQYGDGRLATSKLFVRTATDAAQITAHTGHAILRLRNGDVMGTGGNIYGPVGKHGLGDKAVRWSLITRDATAIATGSSHSLAIRKDGALLAWGRDYGTEPVVVMGDVTAVAAGSFTTIALDRQGRLWQWGRGRPPRQLKLD